MTRTIAALMTLAAVSGCAYVPFRHHRSATAGQDAAPSPAAMPVAVAVYEAPSAEGATCRLDLLKVLEGRPGSAVVAAQALDLSGARSIRWMHPGDAVTMDFRADRLDIKLTHDNIVKSFACG